MLPEEMFTLRGYRKIVTESEFIIAYFRMEAKKCRVIVDLDYHETQRLDAGWVSGIQDRLEEFLRQQGAEKVEFLYVVSTYSNDVGKGLMEEIHAERYWIFDTYGHQFTLYPDNVPAEHKSIYECMLRYIANGEEAVRTTEGRRAKLFGRQALFGINNLLVLINVVVFIWLEVQGSTTDSIFMLEHGVLYWPYVEKFGQWYRVLASVFMHFGFSHLFNNMVVLFFIGPTLERALGKRKYAVLYLLSGSAGNLLSCWYYDMMSHPVMTCGASGAIFGIVGGLLYLVLRNKGQYEDLSIRRMILFIILSMYSGMTGPGVNVTAHIGGMIVGFVTCILLYRKKKDENMEAAK